MKKSKYYNWFKRSNRFVPFEFFSSDPGDWSKYIGDPDCPPHLLSSAWQDTKEVMEKLKSKWIDKRDYLYTDRDFGDRASWCNKISDTAAALNKNKNTPEDVLYEMSIVNWTHYRNICGELGLKFPNSAFTHVLLKRNPYKNFPDLFDHFLNIINSDKDSDFAAHESDCLNALNSMYAMISRFSLLQYSEGELIGDEDVFVKYMEKNQLRIINSINRYLDLNYLSDNSLKSELFINNEDGISYSWRIIDRLTSAASGLQRKKKEEGVWKSFEVPRFALDLRVFKSSLSVTQKIIDFINTKPFLTYMLRPDRVDKPEKNRIYSNRISNVKYLLNKSNKDNSI